MTFPGGLRQKPTGLGLLRRGAWRWTSSVRERRSRLFDPASDAERLAFTRIGDAGRRGLFRVGCPAVTGRPVFHVALPVDSSGGAWRTTQPRS